MFHSVDPRNASTLAAFEEPSREQLEAIVRRAATAARSPQLADPPRRAAALRYAASLLRDDRPAIVALAERETGLPTVRLETELERTAVQLELLATACERGDQLEAIIDHAAADARPAPRPDVRRMLVARGPTVVFGASNFPLAFGAAGGDTGSALAAGCPVIVKGHPSHPGTGELVAAHVLTAVEQEGLPAGTFAHVASADHELAGALVEHPAVSAVAFTGSQRGGRALMDRAAARPRPIPVYAEMGSLNPLVVCPGVLADGVDLAADLAASIGSFAGQLCTKPGLVFVPTGDAGDRFVEELSTTLERHGPQPLLNRSIRDTYLAGIDELLDADELVALTPSGAPDGPGFHATPTLAQAPVAALARVEALHSEHFGPAAVVLRYDDLAALTAALPLLEGQLTATLHADVDADADYLTELWPLLTAIAGRVIVGGLPTGVSVTWAMHHGGPYPASSTDGDTSVGQTSIRRFLRPVAFQSAPESMLPPALRDDNPLGLWRRVDGQLGRH